MPTCRSSEGAGTIDLQTWRLCSCVSQEEGELLRAAQVASQAGVSTPPIVTSTDTDTRTKLPRSGDRVISCGACPPFFCIIVGQKVFEISKEKILTFTSLATKLVVLSGEFVAQLLSSVSRAERKIVNLPMHRDSS